MTGTELPIRGKLLREKRYDEVVANMLGGFRDFCALASFAELRVADFLARAEHPVTISALTAFCWRQVAHESWPAATEAVMSPGASSVSDLTLAAPTSTLPLFGFEERVARLMAPMVRHGLVRLHEPDCSYSLTQAGFMMRSNDVGAWWDEVMLTVSHEGWGAARNLSAVVTGTKLRSHGAAETFAGGTVFDADDHDSNLAALRRRVATRHAAAIADDLSLRLVTERATTVTVIGGGHGVLLTSLLENQPEIRGTLVSHPPAARQAQELVIERGLTARCTLVEGDFLCSELLPHAQDVYIVDRVLPQVDDQTVTRLFGTLAQVMGADSEAWLIEPILEEPHATGAGDHLDLALLTWSSGQLRTVERFQSLAWRSGLQVTTVSDLLHGLTLLVLRHPNDAATSDAA